MAYKLDTLKAALTAVEARIAAAAERVGRHPDEITLVGVTKRHPPALLEAAHAVGIRHVGENYAQELVQKFDHVAVADQLRWHFIGHLQRNKVKFVVGRATLIHAVDSERLAREIDRHAGQDGEPHAAGVSRFQGSEARQRILLAVNVGGEAQKSGVTAAEAPAVLDVIADLAHVRCVGLMTMPPFAKTPEQNRVHFQRLAALRASLAETHPDLVELSMGTTGDFEVAIAEGATIVRVGTALFGPRPT